MAHWKWFDGPVKGPCAGCGESLWKNKDSGIIEYDSKHWHVHCALDKLSEPVPTFSPAPFDWMTP